MLDAWKKWRTGEPYNAYLFDHMSKLTNLEALFTSYGLYDEETR